ncbi:hypothetical protein KI387_001702, partial [Taxus chinensis]
IFLYGGYFKDHASDNDISEKGIILADMWVLDPRSGDWNKVKKLGMPPGSRAGFSMCVHKKRALLFGGVVDMEVKGDVLRSLFLNELYGFQLDNRRWYPLELRKAKSTKDKTRAQVKPEQESGGAVTKRNDGGNLLCESKATNTSGVSIPIDVLHNSSFEMEELGEDDCQPLADQVTSKLSVDDLSDVPKYAFNGKDDKQNMNAEAQTSIPTEAVKPCGRINACMAVGKDNLYLYGGMMEVGDREVTLDDLYILDLNKLDEWKCIIEVSKTEWIEVSDGEDEDDEDEDAEGEDVTESDSEDEEVRNEAEKKESDKTILGVEAAAAILRGEGKKLRRKERRAKIDQIRAELGLSDSQRTPMPGESLRDFFSRTNLYWQMAAYEHTQHTGKELRKDGFDLAETRFKDLKPVLDELSKLEAEQKAEEEEDAKNMLRKKGKEKAKHSILHRTIPLPGKPDLWPGEVGKHIRTLCPEEVTIEDKAMAKRDEKESTMESCIASKLADIRDINLGPKPLSELIDRSRAGRTSLMRAVKSNGIIRAAAFPCIAQLPEFVIECATSYHPSSRSVRDATGNTIIRLDAEFINYCLKIPVRKVATSISLHDAGGKWENHKADCMSIMNSKYMKKPRSPSKFPRTLSRSNLVQEVDDVVKLLCRINGEANAYTFHAWMYVFIRTIKVNKIDSIINWSEIINDNIGEQLRNMKRIFSFKMTSYLVYAAASQSVFSKLDRCGVLSKDPIFECYPQLIVPV